MGGHVKYGGGQGKLAKAAAAASSGNQSVSAIGQVQAFIRYCCRLDKAVRFRSMSFVQRLLILTDVQRRRAPRSNGCV